MGMGTARVIGHQSRGAGIRLIETGNLTADLDARAAINSRAGHRASSSHTDAARALDTR